MSNEPTISTAKVTAEEDTNGFTGFTQEQFLIIVKAAQDRDRTEIKKGEQ